MDKGKDYYIVEPVEGKHKCTLNSACIVGGESIECCFESENGELWAGLEGVLLSQVNYCPVCGFKAPVQIGVNLEGNA